MSPYGSTLEHAALEFDSLHVTLGLYCRKNSDYLSLGAAVGDLRHFNEGEIELSGYTWVGTPSEVRDRSTTHVVLNSRASVGDALPFPELVSPSFRADLQFTGPVDGLSADGGRLEFSSLFEVTSDDFVAVEDGTCFDDKLGLVPSVRTEVRL